jgi:hypothetical protein
MVNTISRDRKYVVIGRGKSSWHSDFIEGGNKSSSSGGTLEGYLKEASDGTPIYDAIESDYATFAKWIYSGPMIDVFLEPGQISKFNEQQTKTLLGMLPALKGGFDTLAVMALADISSLDYVAVDVYLTMLRERVSGVKFGTVQGGKVIWE